MALHNQLGKEGEKMAIQWLKDKGYTILHCNWRYSHYEIDIIASRMHHLPLKGDLPFLHFVEVKTRKAGALGNPEDSVTHKKLLNLRRAADQYLLLFPGHEWISFDVLAITLGGPGGSTYFLLEDLS